MKRVAPIVFKDGADDLHAIEITKDQAEAMGIDTSLDEQRGELETHGPWQIPVKYKALCMSGKIGVPEGGYCERFIEKTAYGQRTMTNVKQGGYELEGYVSINGRKYSAFTSSQIFKVGDKLINVAVIHARTNQ